MSVKMIAVRRNYMKAENKEYNKDDTFTVADDREADRLVRLGRARRASANASPKPYAPAKPAVVAAVQLAPVTPPAYEPQPAPQTSAVEPMTTDSAPLFDTDNRPPRRPAVYKRRDLRSED